MFKQTPKTPKLIVRASLLAILSVVTVASFAISISRGQEAAAATSSTINFQARLLTATGSVVPDGFYNVEFKLYNTESTGATSQGSCTGNCVWVETRTGGNKVRVVNGYLTANLGSVNAFGGSIEWDQELWLTMNVGGTGTPSYDGEMSPRLKLTAVPYALRAGKLVGGSGSNVTVLDGGTPSGSNTIHLPAESGTLCIQSSSNCGFATSSGSGNYIQNGTSVQTAANFYIQSAATNSVGGIIRGAAGQTSSLFQLLDGSTGYTVSQFSNNGYLSLGSDNISRGGQITLNDTTIGNTFTATINTPAAFTASRTITLPDESGTICVQNSTNCGFATSTGSGNYIQNGTAVQTAANFAIRSSAIGNVGAVIQGANGQTADIFRIQTWNGTTATSVVAVSNAGLLTASAGISVTGGLTATGTISLNASSNNNTNINTGTSTGTVTIGGGSAPLVIDSTNFDVSSAGAVSGVTTITTSGNINGQTISSAANFTGTVTIQGGNALTLGVSSSTTGSIAFKGSGGAGTLTLTGPNTPNVGNYTLSIPAITANATICTDNSICSGYASATGSGNYIQNQFAGAQATADFWISGTGRAATALQAPLLDAATSGALNIGTTTATSLQIGNNTNNTAISIDSGTGAINIGTGAQTRTVNLATGGAAQTVTVGSLSGASTLTLQAGTGTATGDLTLQTASGGIINIGGNAVTNKILNLGSTGSTNAASTVNIATTNANQTQSITIGNTTSANNAVLIRAGSSSTAIQLQVAAGGSINLANNAVAQTVNVGTGAANQTVNIGSTTGTSSLKLDAGTGTINIGTSASARSTNIATGAAAQTVTVGSQNGTSSLTLDSGTGAINVGAGAQARTINIGTGAAAQTVTVGSTNGASSLVLQAGTGNVTVKTGGSASAFSIQDTAGQYLFNIDSTNGWTVNNGIIHPNNLIENPSFEAAGSFTATGWNFSAQGSINTVAGAHHGNKEFVYTSNSTLLILSTYKYLEAQPGDQFYGEVWYKAAAGTNGGASFSFTFYDKNKASIGSSPVTNFSSANTSYTLATVSGTAPANTAYVRLTTGVNNTSTTGSWTFDDYSMIRSSQQAPFLFKNNVDSSTAFAIQNAAGSTLLNVNTSAGAVEIGKVSETTGKMTFSNSTNSNTVTIQSGVTTTGYTLTLPTSLGSTGDCLKDGGSGALQFTSCGNLSGTLQAAYTSSLGGTTPEIIVDSTRGGVDIQDVSTPGSSLGTNPLFAVRGQATSSTLGSKYFSVQGDGKVAIGNITATSTLDVAGNAAFTINNTSTNSQALKVEQSGTGDAGIEIKNTALSYYMGIDSSAGTFRISSSQASGSTVNMGYTAVGGNVDSGDRNFMNASKFTASATGTVSSINVYVASPVSGSPNNKSQVAIYSDSSGLPGSRLGFSNDAVVTGNSWNIINLTSGVSVTSGTVYWLAYNTNGSTDSNNNMVWANGTTNQTRWVAQTYGTWPASWSGGASGNGQFSIYAPIAVSGASDNLGGNLVEISGTGATSFKNSTDSTSAFQIQNASGTAFFNADSTNQRIGIGTSTPGYKLDVVGDINISTGSAYKINGTDICTASGCTPAAGSANYIQNQNASAQTSSNFWVSGTGKAATSLQAPLFDTITAGTLAIGTTNATAINLNQNTTVAAGKTLTVTSAATSLTGATTGDALTVSNSTSTGNVATFKDNATNVFTIGDGGIVTSTTTASTSSAFVIQNGSSQALFSTDTFNNTVKLSTIGRNNTSTYEAIWLQGSKNGITTLIGGNDSTAAYVANDFSGSIRFNGSGVAWGDMAYFPQGGGNGNNGQFRFSTTGSALSTTPNAKVGVGDIYVAGNAGIGTNSPSYKVDVAGDVNISTGSAYKINGTNICTSSGCTPAAGSANYIQNQNSVQQASSNFWISGSGRADGGILTNNVTSNSGALILQAATNVVSLGGSDTFTANGGFTVQSGTNSSLTVNANGTGTLSLGSNATSGRIINIGATGTQANTSTINVGTSTGAAQTINIGSTNGTGTTTISSGTGGVNLVTNSASAKIIAKTNTNSTTGFQVQDSLGNAAINVDTSNLRLGVGTATPNEKLQVAGGINIGNTTNTNAGSIRWSGSDFEGYNGTSWISLSNSVLTTTPVVSKRKAINETVNNSSTFQDDDELFFDIGANETWSFRVVIHAISGTTPDFKMRVTAPTGATCVYGIADTEAAVSNGNNACSASSGVIAGSGADEIYFMYGTVANGATPGSVNIQWAQNTTNASDTTVYAGSSIDATRSVGGSGTAQAFIQGGNSFGATAVLGTNDTQALNVRTNGTTRFAITSVGNSTITNGTTGVALTVDNNNSTGNILNLMNNSTNVLTVSSNGNVLIDGIADSAAAFQIIDGSGSTLLNFDTTDGSMKINGTGSNFGGGRLYFGDQTWAYVGEYGTNDSDALQVAGASGIYFGGGADLDTMSLIDNDLYMRGNFTIESTAFTKQYRFRTNGGSLDFEGAGANLYLSAWSGSGFTGTQYTAMILYSNQSRMDVISNYTYFTPGADAISTVDMNTPGTGTQDILRFAQGGSVIGYVRTNGSGTLTYQTFTGAHPAWTNESIQPGMVVSMTGSNKSRDPNNTSAEPYYGIVKTKQANDPHVLGSYFTGPARGAWSYEDADSVMSVGNGFMWVSDEGGNLDTGDDLISSTLEGHAMKDKGTFAQSFVIAKASEKVDWSKETKIVNGHKVKKISVIYTSYTKLNASGLMMGLSSGGIVSNDLEFNGKAIFNGGVTFKSDTTFEGLIKVSDNTAGTVKIAAGQTSAVVNFSKQYGTAPKITTGVSEFVDVVVAAKSKSGFTVRIPAPRSVDTYIDWTALESQ